jgi:hypothetical protein
MAAKKDHRQFHDAIDPPRKARNSKRPRIKYSMTCPDFLIHAWIKPTSWDGRLETRKFKIFSTQENVFCEENVSVDIQKIKPIQKTTGSPYLTTFRIRVILVSMKTPLEELCPSIRMTHPVHWTPHRSKASHRAGSGAF